jgi:hypothetical protein
MITPMGIYVNVSYDEVIKREKEDGSITKSVLHHHKHRCEVHETDNRGFAPYDSSISISTVLNWIMLATPCQKKTREAARYDYAFQGEDTDDKLKVEYAIRSVQPVSEEDRDKLWKCRRDRFHDRLHDRLYDPFDEQFIFDDDGHIHDRDDLPDHYALNVGDWALRPSF